MLMLFQLWFYLLLAGVTLVFIGSIALCVYHCKKVPLWVWILNCIGVGLILLSLPVMFIQLSFTGRRKRNNKKDKTYVDKMEVSETTTVSTSTGSGIASY